MLQQQNETAPEVSCAAVRIMRAQRCHCHEAQAVDSAAAGDCFNGALAVALAEEGSAREAIDFALRAAALSVTRKGASASLPYRRELAAPAMRP